MITFGHFALILGWIFALLASVGGLLKPLRLSPRGQLSLQHATIAVSLCLCTALASLSFGFLADDFSVQYIWQNSSRELASAHKISAVWLGGEGSLLMWTLMLSVAASTMALKAYSYPRALSAWSLPVLNISTLFFTSEVLFLANPFKVIKAPFIPRDGSGLNPVLQDLFLALHPPLLYAGLSILTVPAAFAIAALLARDRSGKCLSLMRQTAILGWILLTTGMAFGAFGAYRQAGWGGFWSWDPVQNAALLPWLTAIALVHSIMIEERFGMLKLWNIWLSIITYCLTVFSAFIARSHFLPSVHAFGTTPAASVFLGYIAVFMLSCLVLTLKRVKDLRPERHFRGWLSRETFLLLNNLTLLTLCFAILWGVTFPLLSQALSGEQLIAGIPYFELMSTPLLMALLVLMGVGPLLAWRNTTVAQAGKLFFAPFSVAMLVTAVLYAGGIRRALPLLSYALASFVMLSVAAELLRGAKARSNNFLSGMTQLLLHKRRRCGGYLVHLGVAVTAIGIASSTLYKEEKHFSLTKGTSERFGRYELRLASITPAGGAGFEGIEAKVEVQQNRDHLGVLLPQIRSHSKREVSTLQTAIRSNWQEDLYLVLTNIDQDGQLASFTAFINPLQIWLWIGILVGVTGATVALIPQKTYPMTGLEESAAEDKS